MIMRFPHFVAAVSLGVVINAPAFAALSGVDFQGRLVSIDTTTGAATLVGSGTGFDRLNSLAANSSGTLFSATDKGNQLSGDDRLLTIDPATGLGTGAATFNFGSVDPDARSMAFRPSDGALFVINAGGGSATQVNSLFRVDSGTGAGTLIANLGEVGIQGLDFSADGRLFGWSIPLGLVTLNPDTGALSDVNPNGSFVEGMQSLAFDASGMLYGATLGSLYSIDTGTGERTFIGNFGRSDIRGIEAAAPIPEPGSFALMAAGAALLTLRHQRAKAKAKV